MRRQSFLNSLGLLTPILTVLLVVPVMMADSGGNHKVSSDSYGVSGGNVNDRSSLFCCSGTLGSLLTDGTKQYILSNNHVLGRSGQAQAGEDVSQPGLIDNGCRVAETVADFTTAPTLGRSNVDAAIAELRSGAMRADGAILDIGTISSVVRTATVGLAVTKSGRTTGNTKGTVQAVNANVSVQYQQGCGKGKKFTVSFTNQVVITPGGFSAGGDSGSLIVTDDACNQPVALLFAGSSSSTIGNPIGQVLTEVGRSLGRSVSFVGDNCSTSTAVRVTPNGNLALQLSQEVIDLATNAMNERKNELMARPAVIGVGVGASDSDPYSASIVIFVDNTTGLTPKLPKRIKGVDVKVIYTDPFVAY
ncbi:MAG: hypothetical protein AB1489_31425 [Acidobacteriota bacterium]